MTRKMIAGGLLFSLLAGLALAGGLVTSTVGVGGYDVVAYHTQGKAVRGSGYHVTTHDGVTYAFVSKENLNRFEANPQRFLPAYGGFCAYGVSVGKKFVSDPEVWKIVDGKLYLNLDRDIQRTWNQDVPGNIVKADSNWTQIRDKAPADL